MFRFEDLLVVLLVALFLFGPNKMVDFAKGLGNAMREFKKAASPDENPQPTVSVQANPAPSALPSESKPADSSKKS
jgi:sec-independent protein translocase protein TatA